MLIKKTSNLSNPFAFVLIGGINLDNVCQLKQFNPDGYALVSGILGAQDIKSRVKSWYEKI